MHVRCLWTLTVVALLVGSAWAGEEKVELREKLQVGQTVRCAITQTLRYHTTTTSPGQAPEKMDFTTTQDWKLSITALAVKDGSCTQARVEVAAGSVDKLKEPGKEESSTDTPYAGKAITVTRAANEEITNNFKGDVGADDQMLLNSAVVPDSDYYPDHPVAVGQTWDVRPDLKKHAGLGPKDRAEGRCRLDWVKVIGGKRYAHISCSSAMIQNSQDGIEETTESATNLLVDVAAGMVVDAEQKGKSTIRTADPHAPAQATGGTEFTYHSRNDNAPATTQP